MFAAMNPRSRRLPAHQRRDQHARLTSTSWSVCCMKVCSAPLRHWRAVPLARGDVDQNATASPGRASFWRADDGVGSQRRWCPGREPGRGLHDYSLRRLIQANARNDDAMLQEVARLIAPIAQGWKDMKEYQRSGPTTCCNLHWWRPETPDMLIDYYKPSKTAAPRCWRPRA